MFVTCEQNKVWTWEVPTAQTPLGSSAKPFSRNSATLLVLLQWQCKCLDKNTCKNGINIIWWMFSQIAVLSTFLCHIVGYRYMLHWFLNNNFMFCWATKLDINSLVGAAQINALPKAGNLLSKSSAGSVVCRRCLNTKGGISSLWWLEDCNFQKICCLHFPWVTLLAAYLIAEVVFLGVLCQLSLSHQVKL